MPQLSPDSRVAATPGWGGEKRAAQDEFSEIVPPDSPRFPPACTEPDLKNTRFYPRFELAGLADSGHSSVILRVLLNSLRLAQPVGTIA